MKANTFSDVLSHINKTNDCWLWTGVKDKDGYGRIRYNGKFCLAHRVVYAHSHKLSDKVILNHLCRTTNCVNPRHLEETTHRINILAGISQSAINARKTHCSKGHEFTNANTYVNKRGWRQCRECNNKR